MYGIFTYIYHKFKANVGKYSSPMEHLGKEFHQTIGTSIPLNGQDHISELRDGVLRARGLGVFEGGVKVVGKPHKLRRNTPWKFNIAPENLASQLESNLPATIFQGLC